jgi:CubicO group peptidase (beta-lactamase class C family)
MLLKDGKIVIEYYKGKTLIGLPFTKKSNWYWASAGKTLTSALVGIAQEEGHLNIQESSSTYLGEGWTSLAPDQEKQIKIIHQLSMTTGLDEKAKNSDCVDPECFLFKATPGTRWSYHNGPYTILDKVISSATGTEFDDYFETKILDPTGMDGSWRYVGDNHVFFSTARSMARFGLLILNKGKWENITIIDESYYDEMTQPSQDINNGYGYLWWLNGYQPIMLPGFQIKLNRLLTPSAPVDMFAAMGKNAEYLNIVPSKGLVMVRMGENPNQDLVPLNFQEDLWQHINKIIN